MLSQFSARGFDHFAVKFRRIQPKVTQDAVAYALVFLEQTEQDVLRAHIALPQRDGFLPAHDQHMLGAGRIAKCSREIAVATADERIDALADAVVGHAHLPEHAADRCALLDAAQQQVLGADVIMSKALRFFLCHFQHALCALGKAVKKVHFIPPVTGYKKGDHILIKRLRMISARRMSRSF